MIRLGWRQFRGQAAAMVGALAVLAVVLGATGPGLAHLYATTVVGCAAHGDCDVVTARFLNKDAFLTQTLGLLVDLVPAVIGVFWGAPLVARELETGTFRLAWTQSVSRTRWLLVKLALVGAASMVAAGLVSLMVSWWLSPSDTISQHLFDTSEFGARGVVPVAYAAFAFALGVTVGILLRRTVPAMATTLVAFLGIRLAVTFWVRPLLWPPVRRAFPLDPRSTGFGRTGSGTDTLQPDGPHLPNAWVYSQQITDHAGHQLTSSALTALCPGMGGPPQGLPQGGNVKAKVPDDVVARLEACVRRVGATYHELVTYQPADRYWRFQWLESGLYVALALALGGFCVWWVRHRLS